MSRLVEIVSVLQTLDLRSKRTINSLVLRLSDGSLQFQVTIENEALEALLARIEGGEANIDTSDTPIQESLSTTASITALTFGVEEVSDPRLEPGQVAVFGGEGPKASASPPSPEPRMRKQKPAMDEMGYPIMPPTSGSRDPGEIVGTGSNQDEDGVSSL